MKLRHCDFFFALRFCLAFRLCTRLRLILGLCLRTFLCCVLCSDLSLCLPVFLRLRLIRRRFGLSFVSFRLHCSICSLLRNNLICNYYLYISCHSCDFISALCILRKLRIRIGITDMLYLIAVVCVDRKCKGSVFFYFLIIIGNGCDRTGFAPDINASVIRCMRFKAHAIRDLLRCFFLHGLLRRGLFCSLLCRCIFRCLLCCGRFLCSLLRRGLFCCLLCCCIFRCLLCCCRFLRCCFLCSLLCCRCLFCCLLCCGRFLCCLLCCSRFLCCLLCCRRFLRCFFFCCLLRRCRFLRCFFFCCLLRRCRFLRCFFFCCLPRCGLFCRGLLLHCHDCRIIRQITCGCHQTALSDHGHCQ